MDLPALTAPSVQSRSLRPAAPHLSVVIVNYGQWENTAALVRQVLASTPARSGQAEVVVVDNHSPPHRLIRRLRRWPGVSVRRWKRNRGFARAVNEGCRLSRGDWFLLLNPDITLADDFIAKAYDLAERLAAEEPRRGVIGFQLRNQDGTRQLSVGRFPSLANTLLGLMVPRARRKYRQVHSTKRCSVPWATGCCLLVRRACLRSVNGFDPSFFLYYEDVDFCRRARNAGWKVAFDPSLTACHHQPLHARAISARMRLITRHGLLNYAAKHWPSWQSWCLANVVRAEAWWRAGWAWWRGQRHEETAYCRLADIARHFAAGDRQQALRRLLRSLDRMG